MPPSRNREEPGVSRILPVCLPGVESGCVLDVICSEDMAIPEPFWDKDLLVVRMDGDGMAPVIRRGAYVGLDRTRKGIRSGWMYGVMVPVEGLVIKRAMVDLETRRVILADGQDKQPPYCFAPEEFRRRVVGRVAWVFQEF